MSASNHSGPLRSLSSDFSSLVDLPACESIHGLPLDWSGRGTSHIDYHKHEEPSLVQGRFLGHGMHGGVWETSCNGVRLAWKRKFCRRKISARERCEIEIIKKLSHDHVVRLIGTYTHGPFLGLLLWPVATCHLASLLEDVDVLQKKYSTENGTPVELPDDLYEQWSDRVARLEALGIPTNVPTRLIRDSAVAFLGQTIGCIAGAVAYLHASKIKHKDLKPSNILLSHDGLWLTDFGTATDFSVLTSSATEDGERGTPKYFAPEVARFALNGRSADIFSMGCVFFEIITLCVGYTLKLTQDLRQSYDRSFHANMGDIIPWFDLSDTLVRAVADEHFPGLVRWMMEKEAARRPTAGEVEEEIALISGFSTMVKRVSAPDRSFYRQCCKIPSLVLEATIPRIHSAPQIGAINIMIGNTYYRSGGPDDSYTFYIRTSHPNAIEKVHMFFVSVPTSCSVCDIC
jgi:serine/threonine protein kinase